MIELPKLRARIAELEHRCSIYAHAPAKVRAVWEFDVRALKALLELLIEKGNRDAGEI